MLSCRAAVELRKAQKQILANPNHFNMNTWVETHSIRLSGFFRSCNTVACIAGWVALNNGYRDEPESERVSEVAHRILGAERDTELQRSLRRLFLLQWPRDLQDRWEDSLIYSHDRSKMNRLRAEIASDAINRFISTEGRF